MVDETRSTQYMLYHQYQRDPSCEGMSQKHACKALFLSITSPQPTRCKPLVIDQQLKQRMPESLYVGTESMIFFIARILPIVLLISLLTRSVALIIIGFKHGYSPNSSSYSLHSPNNS